MKCDVVQDNQLNPARGKSAPRLYCIATLAGFLLEINIMSKEATANYRKTKKYMAAQKRCWKKYREKNSVAIKITRPAYNALNKAVARGIFPRPDTLKCFNCENQAKEYHHHKGYEPEYWFEVIPLCTNCHRNIHRLKPL